ncbi:MAG: BCCT family transporter [Pseudoxanthomonas sp.]
MVFRISILIVALLVTLAGFWPGPFNAYVQATLAWVVPSAGWLYLLVVFATLVFLLFLAFGRFAQLRIGGEDAEPEFSTTSWLAMLFAAGMGIGLVFWGAAEPVSHYARPPEGLQPQSMDAARAAMRYAFFHWGLHPWAIYALLGLAMAWFQYNRNGRGRISDLLQPVLGKHHLGWMGMVVDVAAVVATAIGVATTLGFGTVQIAAGLHLVFGLPATTGAKLAVVGVAFVLYMASSSSGVDRGIKWLSNLNLALAGVLLLLVLLLGPTGFIFDTFTTTLGSYLDHLLGMSLRMSPFSGSSWVAEWTIFYWAWWIAWAPFVGAFIARVSRGRSVREFVLGVVVAPSLLGFAWFSVFGGAALWAQIFGGADMVGALANGYETVLFALFDTLPGSKLLATLALVLLVSFFLTSADSAVLILSSMSTETAGEPPLSRKFAWGAAIALIAGALLLAGGLDALQGLITIAALPFALLVLLVVFGLYRALDLEYRLQARRDQRLRHRMREWMDTEDATRKAAVEDRSTS